MDNDVIEFWNERANMGEAAGTNDVVLKRLEIAELLNRVPFGSRVLDVGCGNGLTLIALAEKNYCSGIGIDIATDMVGAARQHNKTCKRIAFDIGDVTQYDNQVYDAVISERCLINLSNYDEQLAAFRNIMDNVKIGGHYFMIENSYDGLARLNALRALMDLPAMTPPWHNLYFHERDVQRWETSDCVLEQVVPFTSTYYLLSRVVYAKIAEGQELQYESPINVLSLKLPIFGDVGATKLWIWRRME